MKLVDILARELKVWPCDGHTIHQGAEGNIFTVQNGCLNLTLELADDWLPAEVARSQWQAAVDALKAGEQAWDGEGLPPVGTVCEYGIEGNPKSWVQATILYVGALYVLARTGPHEEIPVYRASFDFRPIRTAEQIAEQEHREAVEALAAATDWILTREACEAVLAAGYRKQEVQQ